MLKKFPAITTKRASGVILHLSSLPGPHGIGDMGKSAYQFIRFLNKHYFTYWQMLPINPPHKNGSPYAALSTFAGNPSLISPEKLYERGFLTQRDWKKITQAPLYFSKDNQKVHFSRVESHKNKILQMAYENYLKNKKKHQKAFEEFKKITPWCSDWSLYQALRKKFAPKPWYHWPKKYRNFHLIKQDLDHSLKLKDEIDYQAFVQYLFFQQWEDLKKYAKNHQVKLLGDIPFFVSRTSCDVWNHPAYFKLNEQFQPESISGVPPDNFNRNGQKWGMPLYRWDELKKRDYDWWVKRLSWASKLFDGVRLDHFRGFVSCYEIPPQNKTARRGTWKKTAGSSFFTSLLQQNLSIPLYVEDLGSITPAVLKLCEEFQFSSLKVLQFGFSSNRKNEHLFTNYQTNMVGVSGTHDNNTLKGFIQKDLPSQLQQKVREYLNFNNQHTTEDVLNELIKSLFLSKAKLALFPLQDLLHLDETHRMNIPGTTKKNWQWRFSWDFFKDQHLRKIQEYQIQGQRFPQDLKKVTREVRL